jgi:hypothetical protein
LCDSHAQATQTFGENLASKAEYPYFILTPGMMRQPRLPASFFEELLPIEAMFRRYLGKQESALCLVND